MHETETTIDRSGVQAVENSFSTKIGHNSGTRWIALSVETRNHPIVGCGQPVKPADVSRGAWSRFEAWVDLICEASWRRRQVVNKGRTILLERGELMGARTWLAQRWNWSEKTVRVFLEKLEHAFMVSEVQPKPGQQNGPQRGHAPGRPEGQRRHNFVKVISICNYDIYQTANELHQLMEGQQNVAPQAPPVVQPQGQQRASEGPEQYKVYKDIDPPTNAGARETANPKNWGYSAALDAEERRAQQDVAWCVDGTIAVMNGFEAELARSFPRVNVTAGLAAVAGEQGPAKDRTSAKTLKLAILRRFGYMEQDESGRDRRAAARQGAASGSRQPWETSSWHERQAQKAKRITDALTRTARELGYEERVPA